MGNVYVSNASFLEKCPPALSKAAAQVITDAGISASGLADGYMAKRYALPLVAPFDAGLCLKVYDLMCWEVATMIGFRPASAQNDVITIKYDNAIKWFENISKGLIELPLQIDSTPDVDEDGSLTASGAVVNFQAAGVTGPLCGSCGSYPCCCNTSTYNLPPGFNNGWRPA